MIINTQHVILDIMLLCEEIQLITELSTFYVILVLIIYIYVNAFHSVYLTEFDDFFKKCRKKECRKA